LRGGLRGRGAMISATSSGHVVVVTFENGTVEVRVYKSLKDMILQLVSASSAFAECGWGEEAHAVALGEVISAAAEMLKVVREEIAREAAKKQHCALHSDCDEADRNAQAKGFTEEHDTEDE
jgi:hypothetical protein